MPVTTSRHRTVPFTVERPAVAGPLAVFPLIADRGPKVNYLGFAEAIPHGASVTELPGQASVNDLLVKNPLVSRVLLYEGQEVLGAQQNRTLDVSVLVPAESELPVPVSCVEAGRWDGSRAGEAFTPAPQTANPSLRRMKNAQARSSSRSGGEARAEQHEVWREVQAAAGRHGVTSETGALHDVFEDRRAQLTAMTKPIEMQCSQVGALVAIGGRFVVLDHVSEVEAFATLHDPLLQGYALDALGVPVVSPPSLADARDFVRLLLAARFTREPTVGLGERLSFQFGAMAGSGLVCDDEIVALTAFAEGPASGGSHVPGRVARPSRRRRH
jgi:hypothetical protein